VNLTTDYMDALRLRGDEFADTTVDALFESGDVAHFNTLMRFFGSSGQELPAGLPAQARDYLEQTRMPPDWIDWEVIDQARQFFIANNVHISTALAFAAMPAGYVVPHVARLLATTHSLEYPARRMAETGQFTVYMMRPDAFESGGRFIPAVQKVRLLHASVRHHLRREGLWDQAGLGVPNCQEDMIGALMGFSIQVLDALHRLGIRMSGCEAEAYYYAWRVVGIMLGCDPDAVPADTESARAFSDYYMVRHMGPSPEGARLTRQLIDMYEQVVPGKLLDPIVPALIRYLVGDTVADWLEVPRSHWDTLVKLVPVALGTWESVEQSGPVGRWVMEHVGALASNLELTALTSGRVMHYAIPEHLKDEYDVKRTVAGASRWTPPPVTLPVLGWSGRRRVTGEGLPGLLVRQPGKFRAHWLGTADIVQRCRQHEFVVRPGGNGVPRALQRLPGQRSGACRRPRRRRHRSQHRPRPVAGQHRIRPLAQAQAQARPG
jgi:hypothetical protein